MRVDDLRAKVSTIAEELTILEHNISESYDAYARKLTGQDDTSVQKEITDLYTKQKGYDRQFQEKEAQFQAIGGKTRRQTLQEYTLLLFFTSYLVFASSIAIWKSVKGNPMDGAKIFGLLLLTLVPIIALMLKFL
jgi:hypothetical protein